MKTCKRTYKPTINEYLFPIGNDLTPVNIFDEGETRTKYDLLYCGTKMDAVKGEYADYPIVDVNIRDFGGNVGLEIFIIKSRGPRA